MYAQHAYVMLGLATSSCLKALGHGVRGAGSLGGSASEGAHLLHVGGLALVSTSCLALGLVGEIAEGAAGQRGVSSSCTQSSLQRFERAEELSAGLT